MRLSDSGISLRLELHCGSEGDNCNDGMKLRDRLDRRNRSIDVGSSFTAWMLRGTHLAIAHHLLAAGRLRLCHLRSREAGEHGHSQPQTEQTQDDDGACLRHFVMLHASFRGCKNFNHVVSWLL
jgi:hypothetical protein